METLALHCGPCLSKVNDEQIRAYLKRVWDRDRRMVHAYYSGLKWFYTRILEREWNQIQLIRPRRTKRLPEILSQEELKPLIEGMDNSKHKTALMVWTAFSILGVNWST